MKTQTNVRVRGEDEAAIELLPRLTSVICDSEVTATLDSNTEGVGLDEFHGDGVPP